MSKDHADDDSATTIETKGGTQMRVNNAAIRAALQSNNSTGLSDDDTVYVDVANNQQRPVRRKKLPTKWKDYIMTGAKGGKMRLPTVGENETGPQLMNNVYKGSLMFNQESVSIAPGAMADIMSDADDDTPLMIWSEMKNDGDAANGGNIQVDQDPPEALKTNEVTHEAEDVEKSDPTTAARKTDEVTGDASEKAADEEDVENAAAAATAAGSYEHENSKEQQDALNDDAPEAEDGDDSDPTTAARKTDEVTGDASEKAADEEDVENAAAAATVAGSYDHENNKEQQDALNIDGTIDDAPEAAAVVPMVVTQEDDMAVQVEQTNDRVGTAAIRDGTNTNEESSATRDGTNTNEESSKEEYNSKSYLDNTVVPLLNEAALWLSEKDSVQWHVGPTEEVKVKKYSVRLFLRLNDAWEQLMSFVHVGRECQMIVDRNYHHPNPMISMIPVLLAENRKMVAQLRKEEEEGRDPHEFQPTAENLTWAATVKQIPGGRKRGGGQMDTTEENARRKVLRDTNEQFACDCDKCDANGLAGKAQFPVLAPKLTVEKLDPQAIHNPPLTVVETFRPLFKQWLPNAQRMKSRVESYHKVGNNIRIDYTNYDEFRIYYAKEKDNRFFDTFPRNKDVQVILPEDSLRALYYISQIMVVKLFVLVYMEAFHSVAVQNCFQAVVANLQTREAQEGGAPDRVTVMNEVLKGIGKLKAEAYDLEDEDAADAMETMEKSKKKRVISITTQCGNQYTNRTGSGKNNTYAKGGKTLYSVFKKTGSDMKTSFITIVTCLFKSGFDVPDNCVDNEGKLIIEEFAKFLKLTLYTNVRQEYIDKVFDTVNASSVPEEEWNEDEWKKNKQYVTELAEQCTGHVTTLLARTLANHVEDWYAFYTVDYTARG